MRQITMKRLSATSDCCNREENQVAPNDVARVFGGESLLLANFGKWTKELHEATSNYSQGDGINSMKR